MSQTGVVILNFYPSPCIKLHVSPGQWQWDPLTVYSVGNQEVVTTVQVVNQFHRPELWPVLQDSSLLVHQRRRRQNTTAPTVISAKTMTVAHTTDAIITSLLTLASGDIAPVAKCNGADVVDEICIELPVMTSYPLSTTWM